MTDNTILKIIRFLSDESDENEIREVKTWIGQNPEEFHEIKLIFENTPFEQKEFDIEKAKKLIFNRINFGLAPEHQRKIRLNYWIKIAAVFIGLLTIGASLYFYQKSLSFEYKNLTAEIQELILPDGSQISLDKNAVISYKKNWFGNFNRNINLKGRAYFQITKDKSQRFTIKDRGNEVEVFGTKFSVSDYYDRFQVVLNEGKVKVTSNHVDHSYFLSNHGEQLIITQQNVVKQNTINQNLYFSWLDEKLNFKNCKVSEALEFLSDSYNIDVIMEDNQALEKHLIGSAQSDNPMLIIDAIAKITHHSVVPDHQKIIIK